MEPIQQSLQRLSQQIEQLARRLGMDFYPVDFELVPNNFMMEIAVYGLPVRMPHWSFGVRYIRQLIQQGMGHSRIFEVMFPGDPCRAYLVNSNSLAENTLVLCHVLGHADFTKNNRLFAHFLHMAGGAVLEQAAARAHRIESAIEDYGQERVEALLDAALALEPHIDVQRELHRPAYRTAAPTADKPAGAAADAFQRRYQALPGAVTPRSAPPAASVPVPPAPEADLLWFIAMHAPELADWERDIFLAVREESFYFYPVFACQIMNEGWASYWHARLLREADFLPDDLYLSALKAHSDVVRPFAADRQLALAVNPYHLGFSIWEHLIEKRGMDAARRIRDEEDDVGFIRNYLDEELAERLDLFTYQTQEDGGIRIAERNIHRIREAILKPKFNYGAPRVAVTALHQDGKLELQHDAQTDGCGLDVQRAERVLYYLEKVWRRPVLLHSVDERGSRRTLHGKPD